ncbi:MAG: exodeoxyribonuclease III [Bdellovibrionales bacterium]|nr:exodeoxyribonuclease III [Bdellovibrionales bacterium]
MEKLPVKIVSWNVNGIRACTKKGFIDFVERERPDVLCLQETKAHSDQLDETILTPLNYDSYWTAASTRKGYSGTATYTTLPVEKVEHGIGIKKFDDEGRFVVTQIHDVLLYNVYFPNGSAREERHDYKQEFLKKFHRHLIKKMASGHKIIVLGDYNVAHKEMDVYDPVRLSKVSGFLPEERDWFQQFLDSGFIDTFRYFHPDAKERFSWWSYREMARPANRGWRIDYICVSENLKPQLKSADIWDQQEGSDHCPVVLELEI